MHARIESPPREASFEPMDPQMVEALRAMTGQQRLEIAGDMRRTAREMLLHMLRSEHPDWTDQEVALEVARRLLAGELPLGWNDRVQAIEALHRGNFMKPPIGRHEALD